MNPPVIVVGLDGSPASRTALRWALEEATRTGSGIEAVMAWERESEFVPASSLGVHPYAELLDKQRRHPARELHELVVEIRHEVPGAPEVAEVTMVGDASSVLVQASKRADLLVIGTRGRNPLAEVLLGSVATDCVRNAACPVVVIPKGAVQRSSASSR